MNAKIMKKNVIFKAALMAACCASLVWSCAKENVPETANERAGTADKTYPSVISAGIPEDLSPKVSLSDEGVGNGLSMAWEEDDQIRVIATAGGSGSGVFTIQEGFTPTQATFSGTPVAGTQYTVFYPGRYADVAALNARSYAVQTQIGNGSTDHLEWNAIETGLSNYSTLSFATKQNGAIRFHLTLPASFTKAYSVTLSAPSAIFSVDNGDSDQTDELVLNLKSDASTDGITLGNDKVLDAFMMVSWNNNVFSAGTVLTVKVQGEEADPWTRSSTIPEGDFTLAGGKVTAINFGDQHWDEPLFWGGSGTQADPYQIKTLRNLKNLYTGSANKDTYYVLIDDIALSSEEAAAYAEINNFYGHLDGGNHAITGLETPLFGDLYGWVSDLDITANISFNGTDARIKGVDYGLGILAHYIYNTDNANAISRVTTRGSLTIDGLTKSHAYQVGGLAASSNGVPLSACKNYADITVESVNVGSANFRVGGVAGVLQSSTRVSSENCENHGAITVKAVTAGSEVAIAGVFGYLSQENTVITNCDNTGAVSVTYSSIGNITWNAVGGIVGISGSAVSLQNCDNSGAISNANTASKAYDGNTISAKFSTGGVGAYLKGAFTMTSCSSTGAVSGVSWVGGLLGRNSNGNAQITSCWSTGTLTTMGASAIHCIGGIAGEFVGTLQKSYSTMTIRKNTALSKAVGGLVGDAYNSSMTLIVKECYYDGTMEGASQIGGLVGHSRRNVQIQNSYVAGSITGNAGYMASIIGYVNNGASCEVTNCYSKMAVATTASGNAIGGLIGGADTATNSWNVSGLLAWNSSISFQTNNTTDGVVIGQMQSGTPTSGTTSFANCWYRNDLSYLVKGTAKDISTNYEDVTTGGKKIYNGRRVDSGVTCSQKAAAISWDGTTIWDLSADYPALRRVVAH